MLLSYPCDAETVVSKSCISIGTKGFRDYYETEGGDTAMCDRHKVDKMEEEYSSVFWLRKVERGRKELMVFL